MIKVNIEVLGGTIKASVSPSGGSLNISQANCQADTAKAIKDQYESYMAQANPRTSRDVLIETDFIFNEMKSTTLGVKEVRLTKTI